MKLWRNVHPEPEIAVGDQDVRDFLDRLALGERDESDRDSKLAKNAVALLTLHSAKGLEFAHVFLVGLEEEILPHARSVERVVNLRRALVLGA